MTTSYWKAKPISARILRALKNPSMDAWYTWVFKWFSKDFKFKLARDLVLRLSGCLLKILLSSLENLTARQNLKLLEKNLLEKGSNFALKCAHALSGFARNFLPLEKILLKLARLKNWKAKILLETCSARKPSCSFFSNSKNFCLVSALPWSNPYYLHFSVKDKIILGFLTKKVDFLKF